MVFQLLQKQGGNTSEHSQLSKSRNLNFFLSLAQAGMATDLLWTVSHERVGTEGRK